MIFGKVPVRVYAAEEISVSSHTSMIQEMVSKQLETIKEGITEIREKFVGKNLISNLITMIKDWLSNLWLNIIGENKTYTVMFMYNYGDKEAYKIMTIKEGENVYLGTQPARSGYSFEGWYIDAFGEIAYDFNNSIYSCFG